MSAFHRSHKAKPPGEGRPYRRFTPEEQAEMRRLNALGKSYAHIGRTIPNSNARQVRDFFMRKKPDDAPPKPKAPPPETVGGSDFIAAIPRSRLMARR